jgi:isopentenyl-diphosphate delta-isomerase
MEERFDTFAEDGRPLGLRSRSDVHRLGLWHRSAHVFLFNKAGELLIQQRAHDKDLYACLWDYSVGEHLVPGETFAAGAARGLREELGVCGVVLEPIGTRRRARMVVGDAIDAEEQQAFRGLSEGPFRFDPAEVARVRFIALGALADEIGRAPERFTPWFVRDLDELGLLP